MCFSAAASFGAAAVLTGLGTGTTVFNDSSRHRMFAAIPLLFGLQQAAEGVVWLTVDHDSGTSLHRLAVTVFLTIAQVVWPTWVPLSVLKLETDPGRRRRLQVLLACGLVVSAYAGSMLLLGVPAASVYGHSIAYAFPDWYGVLPWAACLGAYVIPTVLPLFTSSQRLAKTTGLLVAASLVLTLVIQREAMLSVWCFFSAWISLVIALGLIAGRRARRLVTRHAT